MQDTPWLTLAENEIGVREVPGARHNQAILDYATDAKLSWKYTSDEIAWCMVFVNAMLERCGVKGTRSAWARDTLKWGRACSPQRGAVVVLTREGGGHVGFFAGMSADGRRVRLLGGNQSNSVCYAEFDVGRVLGYRLPNVAGEQATDDGVPVFDAIPERPSYQDVKAQLLEDGSRTLANTEFVKKTVTRGGGGFVAFEMLQRYADQISNAVPLLERLKPALATVKDYQILIVAALAAAVVYAVMNIEHARVDDHATGKHVGLRTDEN